MKEMYLLLVTRWNANETKMWKQRIKLTFIPCHREMARKGLNALNVLKDLSADKLAESSTATLMTETVTMTKSSAVQTDEK